MAEGDCSGNPFGGACIKGFSLISTQVRDSQVSSLILSAFFLACKVIIIIIIQLNLS